MIKRFTMIGVLGIAISALMAFGISACSDTHNGIDAIKRDIGQTPGTFINYGSDGQVVFEAHCMSISFDRDTTYDRYNNDNPPKLIEQSSVVRVSCGNNIFSTVGFTSVYMTDGAKKDLFADSQKFASLRITNNDRGIPLINFAWRDMKNHFVGTAQVAQVCDQNNNPILAFASQAVVGYATSVDKSTMFQLHDGNDYNYVLVIRGSYTVLDTDLLNKTNF